MPDRIPTAQELAEEQKRLALAENERIKEKVREIVIRGMSNVGAIDVSRPTVILIREKNQVIAICTSTFRLEGL
jgi:hypothetical protein